MLIRTFAIIAMGSMFFAGCNSDDGKDTGDTAGDDDDDDDDSAGDDDDDDDSSGATGQAYWSVDGNQTDLWGWYEIKTLDVTKKSAPVMKHVQGPTN